MPHKENPNMKNFASLIADRPFMDGITSVFSVVADDIRTELHTQSDDAISMRSDWEKVGDCIRVSITEYGERL